MNSLGSTQFFVHARRLPALNKVSAHCAYNALPHFFTGITNLIPMPVVKRIVFTYYSASHIFSHANTFFLKNLLYGSDSDKIKSR